MAKKILIIKHGALGDMIFAMGAFKAIRDHHKKDVVILLTSSPFKKLAEECPYFDDVWIDDRQRPWQSPFVCLQLFHRLTVQFLIVSTTYNAQKELVGI